MDPKNKTLIPLIIVFFILGAVVGYVAHKPETITKVEYINKTVEVIVTVTPTPTPTLLAPTPSPTPIPTLTIDFTAKNYNPDTDKPTKTIELTEGGARPKTSSVQQGNTVLIKIIDTTLLYPLRLSLTSANTSKDMNLGTSGAVVVTFNSKGTYSFKAVILSSDPTILPKPYAEGTISVY